MAQVMMPQVKEDDSLNNIMAGLSIYSNVSDLRTKAMQNKMKDNSPKPQESMNTLEAMQRRSRAYGSPNSSSPMEMME